MSFKEGEFCCFRKDLGKNFNPDLDVFRSELTRVFKLFLGGDSKFLDLNTTVNEIFDKFM